MIQIEIVPQEYKRPYIQVSVRVGAGPSVHRSFDTLIEALAWVHNKAAEALPEEVSAK